MTICFSCFTIGIAAAQAAQEAGSKFIYCIFKQNYEQALNLFDESVKSKVTIQILQNAVEAIEDNVGKFKTLLEINEEKQTQFTTLYYYSQFEKSNVDIKIICNNSNKILGFFLAPPKDFKSNNNESVTFTKNNYPLNIKAGSIELPGIILHPPDSNNVHVLTIYVHGSGPLDRDETIGQNKPFKDLAEELYKYGISSYRFDKRTLIAPQLFITKNYTIDHEVTNDVYSIVNFFLQNDTFKNYKIVLIGHSLGGMLLPKIADSLKNKISGLVLLAANTRPLETILLEQYKYIYSLQPSTELKNEIKELTEKIRFLHSKKFSSNASNKLLPLNLPFSYWNSLLKYNQIKTAQKLITPVLILQGLRDFQVTETDYKLWKSSFSTHKNTSFIAYPKLNHLFLEGSGKSTPQEYSISKNIPKYVIADIANWIIKLK